ncbi:chalcone isomerase family protein [Bermanella sp. R86510]|uniref:chalcone isomerase family protein n=1 Tax=unclassified Bermanella TaxID=2627862 RepID=UPI0037C86BF9
MTCRLWAYICFTSLLLATTPVYALTLNGIAQYTTLGQPIYIAALYLPEKQSQRQQILQQPQFQRMLLKVTAQQWRARQWQKQWLNDININNRPNVLSSLQEDIQRFTQILPSGLQKGDEVRIEYHPEKGTQIFINGEQILQTKDRELYVCLLKAWLGNLPPSREFKKQILGIEQAFEHQHLLNTLQQLPIKNGRQDIVATWKAKQEQQRVLAEKKRVQLAAMTAKPKQAPIAKQPNKPARIQLSEEQKWIRKQKYLLDQLNWRIHQVVFDQVKPPAWILESGKNGNIEFSFKLTHLHKIEGLVGDNERMPVMLVSDVHRAIKTHVPKIEIPPQLEGTHWEITLRFPLDLQLTELIKAPKKPEFMAHR